MPKERKVWTVQGDQWVEQQFNAQGKELQYLKYMYIKEIKQQLGLQELDSLIHWIKHLYHCR